MNIFLKFLSSRICLWSTTSAPEDKLCVLHTFALKMATKMFAETLEPQ